MTRWGYLHPVSTYEGTTNPRFGTFCNPANSEAKVRLLIAEADEAFRSIGKKIASGDPDLFVYNEYTGDRFFVEVKENDQITDNQKILFPLVQKFLCPVFIARVIEEVIG